MLPTRQERFEETIRRVCDDRGHELADVVDDYRVKAIRRDLDKDTGLQIVNSLIAFFEQYEFEKRQRPKAA